MYGAGDRTYPKRTSGKRADPPSRPVRENNIQRRVNLGHLRTIIANYEILEKRHKEVSDVPERLVEGDVEQGKEKDVPKLLEKMLLAGRDHVSYPSNIERARRDARPK